MAWTQVVETVRHQVRRWFSRPAPAMPEVPVTPKRTMAEVELPPVVGLNKGKRYHAPNCGFVQASRGKVVPFRTREEAHTHGLEPCNVCQPSPN